MKFILLAEGDTEKESAAHFLKRWLDPQLSKRVGIQVVRFQGWADLVNKVVKKAQAHLNGPGGDQIIAVIALLDLYGPEIYPGHAVSAKDRHDWGVAHFEKQVGSPKFRMFFAVHEYEAWLLSQPELLPEKVQKALPGGAVKPETVNFDEPPAKLLDRLFKAKTGRGYKKTTYGKELFGKLDPAAAAQKCPYLKAMLEDMLALAKAAGL